MNSVEYIQQIRRHFLIPNVACYPKAASLGTRVVDLVAFLCGTFGIDPEAYALSLLFGKTAELRELMNRIKDNVVSVFKKLAELVIPVCGAEYVDLAFRHLLLTEARFIKPARLSTGKTP